ncbi:MAG: cation:proton antiporter [Nitrospira sp.]|nr:cation:proton antiporter [bacterium]MBL7048523.1 cation:proton antiporter [Nitrospira sp.]
MQGDGFFFQAFVYLTAAVVSVPIAKKAGLGSVLGYLLAGIIIGPFGLSFTGQGGQDVMHFAEFGVVMMLFLIGLELQPSLLWRLRGPILGMGGLQVGLSVALITSMAMLMGMTFKVSLAIGMTLALSSTAIVLQTLKEKSLMKTDAGQSSFAVLLFQDIAVIPMLAIMPLLASADLADTHIQAGHNGTVWIDGLPGWGHALAVIAVIAAIILAGMFLVRPFFRAIAKTQLRELFTAAALLLVIGIALLMSKVGLSPALGTFLAGVVLANSEYRHELEGDIEPFKGLLLGLFFIAVGSSIDFGLISSNPGQIGLIVGGLMCAKLVILLVLGRVFKMGNDQNILFAFSLAQGGEFAFVLFSFAVQNNVFSESLANPLIAAVAISMALTPLLLLVNEKVFQPRFGTKESESREADKIDEENPVIIAGFGNFGSIIGRLLRANDVSITVLEQDSDKVELLRKLGLKVFYGNAARHDLLHSAGAEKAKLLVLAVGDSEKNLEICNVARKHFPHLIIFARASGRSQAYELLDAGIDHVYRETLDTSLKAGIDVLRALGFRSYHAHRITKTFRLHDEESIDELRHLRHDQKKYIGHARQRIEDLEQLLLSELKEAHEHHDAGWDTVSMREEFGGKQADK